MPQLWGSCEEFPLPLPKTPSLFCAFIPYSCDHLGAMLSLSFPDSAGISGSFPLHLLLQKAPGLRSALPPVFVGLSLPPRPLSPPPLTPYESPQESAVTCFYFLLAPVAQSHLTCLRYSSVAGGKRGQLLPGVSLAAWAAASSSSLGVAGAVAALSPLLSHHGWAAAGVTGLRKSGAPRKAAQLSLPPPPSPCPCKAREGLRDFSPLPPPFGSQEGHSKPEVEAGKLMVVVEGELMAIVGSKGFLRSPHWCLWGLSQNKAPVAPPACQG